MKPSIQMNYNELCELTSLVTQFTSYQALSFACGAGYIPEELNREGVLRYELKLQLQRDGWIK
jgi:hypothetical protein